MKMMEVQDIHMKNNKKEQKIYNKMTMMAMLVMIMMMMKMKMTTEKKKNLIVSKL